MQSATYHCYTYLVNIELELAKCHDSQKKASTYTL
jgi:hypothetical protein